MLLTIVAVGLTVAFFCLVCVAIPCWVWRLRRRSKLRSGDSEVGARVFGSERAYQVAEQSQTDMSEGIYGRGPQPVTVTEMMPINEMDEDYEIDEDLNEQYVE